MRHWYACLISLVLAAGAYAQGFGNNIDPMPQDSGAGLTQGKDKPALIKRGTTWRIHAQRETPELQFDYADALRRDGRLKAAYKAFNALVYAWPDTSQAVTSQLACAQIEEARQRPVQAFDEYQYLVDFYVGRFDYAFVLERQFALATEVMDARHGKFLWLPGFEAPERAIPLFEKIIRNAPSSRYAPQAQFNIGLIHERNEEWAEAVTAYEILQTRYDGDLVATAAYRQVYCLYRDSQERPNDEAACNMAHLALHRYVTNPANNADSNTLNQVSNILVQVRERIETRAYERARFYDENVRKPDAALKAYDDFISHFPHAPQAEAARERIIALRKLKGDAPDESP